MTNLLDNGGFNGNWTRKTHTGQEFGEIFVPEGWTAYWDESQGRPEMHVIEFVAPFIDPPRVCELPKAVKWFTFFRNHRAGIYQRVTGLLPGARYRLTAQAHAWYSQRDNAHLSEYQDDAGVWHTIEDGDPGMAFYLMVDTDANNDPWLNIPAERAANIYDAFDEIALEFVATGDAVTVFIESATLYPFKHCDAYVDDARLELIEAPAPPPGVDYVVTVELLPQDFTLDEIEDVVERTFEQRRTFLQSADDAVRLVVPGLPGSKVDVWEPQRFYLGDIVQWLHDRGVEIVDVYYLDAAPTPPPPPPPPPDWTPRRYIPTGLTTGFMGLGNCGLPQLYNDAGVTAAAIKLQQAIWDIGLMPAQFRTIRLDDWPPLGYRFSGFDYNGDPIAQAETRMSQLLPLLEPLRGQFEFLEYVNEANPPHDRPELAANIALFSIRAMDIAEAAGWKLANLSFSTGEPTLECWDVIAQTGFLERCAAGEHAIALHAYLDHRVPSDIANHLCRYRYLWDTYVLPCGLDIPMILTELGPRRDLLTQIDALDFVAAVDNELRKDPYAMGQLYTVSDIGTEADYDAFWRAAYPRFIQYAALVWDRINGEEPPPPPPPPDFVIVDVRDQLATNPDSPWYPWQQRTLDEITHIFVHHSAGVASSSLDTVRAIAVYHTSPTGKDRPGICYTYVIGADGTTWYVSDIENVVFSQGSVDYIGDENRYGMGVCLLGSFINGNEPTAAQMQSLDALIAYTQTELGRAVKVWGHKDVIQTQCPGDSWPFRPEWGRLGVPVPEPTSVIVGFNDHPGLTTASDWMRANGLPGLIVRPIFLGGSGSALDFSQAAAAGQRVIVNLRYSWSVDMGGAGTMPRVGSPDWQPHVDAMIFTINNSVGVWGFELWNEMNNPRESPITGMLTPADVSITYNAIRAACPGKRLAIGALDPFNAELGDPRDWLIDIYEAVEDVDFVTAHGYIRGPDADLVGSTAKFADWPLTWQYLNYPLCCTELLSYLPDPYKFKPVYITEFNHLWKTVEGDWGWVNDARAAEVVTRAIAAASAAGLAGWTAYRWAGDAWAVENNEYVKNAIREAF